MDGSGAHTPLHAFARRLQGVTRAKMALCELCWCCWKTQKDVVLLFLFFVQKMF